MKRIVTAKKMKKKLYFSIMIFVLTAVMAFSAVGACFFTSPNVVGNASADKSDLSSLKGFDKDKVLSDLKADLIKSINKDLIKNVSDYKLSGRVNAIITFSETSLVDEYNTNYGGKGTLEEFLQSSEAKKYVERVTKRQSRVTDKLVNEGLVSNVKYGYNAILDGVYVSTTYENLEAITKFDGVSRVIVSNTYLPAVATENPVNVYDTGIFNSSDVSYTGKGTIVAILDTGCDYTHTAFNTHQVSEPLYDRNDIDKLLPNTLAYGYDNTLEAREVYYGNITKNKIAWGYDYADKDPDVMPFASDHGTHVAGIIGGKDDVITGVAVDTQLAIMKVFSDYKDGADDGDILAALEDCVKLGVDAINMSLGTSCGFTREVDEDRKNQIYDSIEKAGISLVVAASNDYSSAYGSEFGNTNKTRNPDSATVGAPSTYSAALSVASINGNKDKYMLANGEREVFFLEAFNQSAKEYNFFEMMGITEGNSQTFDYVAIPGYGYSTNYVGADVTGKIALVKRGDISFEEKVQFAYENGAIAVIIYNNVFGDIVMTVGNDVKIPVVSIGKDDGDILASVNKGTEQEGRGTLKFEYSNQAGPFMSDFSSWGPNPDLTLKPEITAHGGNIYSAVPGGGYDKLSGTSMACPNMCGITILIRQYVKENFPELTTCEVRDLVNQLCMSTATIALDKKGNPYSPRKQGAGIADIKKATSTNAYLFVEGKGKTKLELGDDPNRTGVYTMTVSLKNISDKPVSYKIGNLTMTESLSSSDKKYVAEMAYMLSNSAKYSVEGGTLSGSTVTVAAGQTAKVTATITLSPKDKVYINNSFENGMYVEGFLTFDNTDENGVDLNAPFLAFFGDWSDAPIFDEDYYVVETEAHNNAIDDEDKIKADYYATTPLGKYYYDYIIPLGSYVYDMDDGDTPIPATAEHAAISYYKDCISGVYAVFTGLLRGAKEMNIKIVNTATGEVVWEKTEYNAYKAHYSGIQYPYVADIDLDMANTKTGEVFGDNNAHYEVTMSATLDWNGGERNVNDTYKFSFYIDYEAPMIIDSAFRTEYDKTRKENRYYVDLTVYDNHYAMSLRPVVLYSYVDEKGQTKRTFASLSENAIPVYQEKRASQTKVSVEITDYIDVIKQSGLPEGITFYIDDFAMNSNVYYVPFPELQNNNLEFVNQVEGNLVPTLNLKKGQTFDLTTIMRDSRDPNRAIEKDYLKNLTWTSSNPNVVAVSDGKIEAMQENTGIKISVKGETWDRAKELIVNVIGETDDPSSSQNVQIEDIAFTSYKTVYAYNGDIDRSEIGRTDGIGYFDGNYTLNFYPGESVQLNYSVKPWNLSPSRYKLKWSSSNEKVATVDDKGVVKGLSEGRARIFLNIEVDGRDSILQARCTVNIKSEFVIENRELVAYKGLGGVVEIPDDKGILYIGSFAFCHYNLDNEKEVGDKYDLDEKKEPLGNNSVTKVIIPDGVEEIRKFAFYNCEVLQEVVIGKDCKKIFEYAFYKNTKLLNINLDNVKVISDYAFAECSVLNNNDNGGLNFASVNVLGKYSFANCKQLLAANLTDLRRSGEGAFYGCSKLSTVVLGERARLAEQMFANSAVGEITVYSDTIPDGAFYGCTRLSRVTVANDITYLGDEAFRGCTRLYNFAFNGECEYIGSAAFYGCTSLAQFVLPNGTVAFGDNVFGSCSSLKYVTLGAETQISDVGAMIFNGLGGTSIGINAALSNYYKVSSRVLFSKDGTELILALPNNSFSNGTYVVPASVKIIRDGAFSANRNLVTLDARSCSLEKIGDSAFSYCVNLTTVLLGGSNVDIGNLAFCEAVALRTIDLGDVSIIGDFAFYNTNLQTAAFKEGAAIGYKAFSVGRSTVTGMNFSGRLTNVYLGKNNVVSDYAFAESAVITVEMPSDGGVTVGAYAFYNCASLERIDLTKVSQIGEYSFARCVKLSSVDLGNLTEVPEAAFSGASSLKSVTADNLVTVGKDAFSQLEFTNNGFPVIIDGPVITEIDLPSAKEIGDYAFYGCMQLQTANIPLATEIGEAAFQFCEKLENVTLSENLKIVSDGLFYGCEALDISSFDFKNVEKVGKMSFLAVKLPATLNLPEVTQLGEQAFGEAERKYSQTGSFEYVPSQNPVLVSVNAPKLTALSDYAFYGNGALKTLNAPNLRYIGYMAFSKTAVSEFEVNDSLEFVSYGAFFEADVLSAFYATVKGEKTYDAALKNVKVHQGVLYLASEKGYVLANYPMAKTASEYTVPEGTVRIEFMAGYGNKALEKVVLAQTMKFVGNMAFYSCDNLKTVEFRSYYAPTLEGTMSGTLDILPDAVDAGNFPKFDELYKYDYYYYMQKQLVKEALENGSSYTPEFGVPYPLYYANFVDFVTTKKASALTYVIPDNCSGYDSALYKAYFNKSEETSGKVTGSFAVAFIEAVGEIKGAVDRFSSDEISNAVSAYNALVRHQDELALVDKAVIDKYNDSLSRYNVDVVKHLINKLTGIDSSNRSRDLISQADAAYKELSESEKAQIDNYAKLQQAKTDFAKAVVDYRIYSATEAINKLEGLDASAESYALLKEAVNAYNALTANEKEQITNYAKLQQAIADYNAKIAAANADSAEANGAFVKVAVTVSGMSFLLAVAMVMIKKLMGGSL